VSDARQDHRLRRPRERDVKEAPLFLQLPLLGRLRLVLVNLRGIIGCNCDGAIARMRFDDIEARTTYAVTERSNAATEERLKSGHAVGGLSIV